MLGSTPGAGPASDGSIPRSKTVRAVTGVMIGLCALGVAMPDSKNYFGLIPSLAFSHVWTIVTAGFFETTPIMVRKFLLSFNFGTLHLKVG